jgi:hypothetical protein
MGLSRPVAGKLYLYIFYYYYVARDIPGVEVSVAAATGGKVQVPVNFFLTIVLIYSGT